MPQLDTVTFFLHIKFLLIIFPLVYFNFELFILPSFLKHKMINNKLIGGFNSSLFLNLYRLQVLFYMYGFTYYTTFIFFLYSLTFYLHKIIRVTNSFLNFTKNKKIVLQKN